VYLVFYGSIKALKFIYTSPSGKHVQAVEHRLDWALWHI